MSTTQDGVLEIALNSNWFFTDTLADDFIMRTQNINQNIAIGTASNVKSAIYISSNSINLNKPVIFAGGFDISGTANTAADFVVGGTATVCNNLVVHNITDLRSNVFIDGPSTFQKLVTLSSNLTVNGMSTLCNLQVNGLTTFSNNVVITGQTINQGNVNFSNNLILVGNAFLQSNVVVTGDVTLSNPLLGLNRSSLCNTVDISGQTHLSNTLTVTSNLWAQGVTSFSNVVNVIGQANFSNNIVASSPAVFSNIVNISSNLLVKGNVSFSNPMNIAGGAHFSNFARITSNLWVIGATSLSNNLDVFGTLTVSNITNLQSNVVIAGNVTMSNPATMFGLVTISNDLLVYHPVTLSNNQTITGVLRTSSNVFMEGVVSLSNQINVYGGFHHSNFARITSNLWVNGDASFSNDVFIFGDLITSNVVTMQSNVIIAGQTTMSNVVNMLGMLSLSNVLNVSNRSHFSNTVNITSNLWVEGTTSMSNTMFVHGTTTFASNVLINDKLDIIKETSLSNSITVLGLTSLCNTLAVYGQTHMSNTVMITSNLWVNGITTLSNTLMTIGNISACNTLNVASGAHFSNFVRITSNLWVIGTTSLSNNLDVAGSATISNITTLQSNLLVFGTTTLSNATSIFGAVTLSNNVQTFLPVSLSNRLDVSGITTMSNAAIITSNLWVQGVMSASNLLNVAGAAHFSNFVRVTSNLWVNGATSLSNNLNVFGNLTVSNITALQSNVVIAGQATFSNTVMFLSNVTLSNNVTAFFPTTFQGIVAFSNTVSYNSNLVTIGQITACNNIAISSNLSIRGNQLVEGIVTHCNIVNLHSNLSSSNADATFANFRTTGASNQQVTISSFRGLPQLRIHQTSNIGTNPFIITQSSNGMATLSNTSDIELWSASNIRLNNAATISNNSLTIPGITVTSGTFHASNIATFASNVFMGQSVSMCNNVDISGITRLSNVTNFFSNVIFNQRTNFNDIVTISNVLETTSNVNMRGLITFSSNVGISGMPASEKLIIYGDMAISNTLGKAYMNIVDNGVFDLNGFLIGSTITSNFTLDNAINVAASLRASIPTQLLQFFAADIPSSATSVSNWGTQLVQSIANNQPTYTVSNSIFPFVSMTMSNPTSAPRFLNVSSNIGPFNPALSNAFTFAFFARFLSSSFNSNEQYFGFSSPLNNAFFSAAKNAGTSNLLIQMATGGQTAINGFILYNTWTSYVIIADGSTNTYVTYRNGVPFSNVNAPTAFPFSTFVSDFLGRRPTNHGVLGNNGTGDFQGSTVDYAAFSMFQYALSPASISNWHHSMMSTMTPTVAISASLSNRLIFTSNLLVQETSVLTGMLTLSNNLNALSNVIVAGTATFCNDTTFNSNALTLFNSSNVFVGSTTFSNPVSFLSNVTFRNTPIFTSNVIMNCNLSVNGVTSLCNDVNIASNLSVQGTLTVQSITTSNILIFDVNTVRSNLFVLNNTTLCNNVSIFGPTSIQAQFDAYSNASFRAGIVVTSNSTFSNNVNFLSNMNVSGVATISNAVNITGVLTAASNITLSNFGTFSLFTSNNSLGIGMSNPSERLELISGNAKFPANIFLMSNLAIGTSNTNSGIVTVTGCNFTTDTPALFLRNLGSNNSNNTVSLSMATTHTVAVPQVRITGGAEATATALDGFLAFSTRNNSSIIERARLNSAGFFGIGTRAPLKNLHISSNAPSVMVSSTNSNTGPRFELSNEDNGLYSYFGHESNQTVRIGTVSQNDLILITSNTERMRLVSNTGFVGINNSNPAYRLDIIGGTGNGYTTCNALRVWTQVIDGSNSDAIVLSEDGAAATARQGIAWRSENSTAPFLKARIWSLVGPSFNASMLGFDVADSSRVIQTRMVIDTQGRLGLGTTSPSERFHLSQGHARFDSNAFVIGSLSVGNTNTTYRVNIDGTVNLAGIANNGPNNDARAAYLLMTTNDVNAPTMGFHSIGSNNHLITFDSYMSNLPTRTTSANPFAIGKSNNRFLIRYAATGLQNSTFSWSNALVVTNQGLIGINTDTPSEVLDVVGGNVKINSNLYVMSNLGIGRSNPAYMLDVAGSINFTGSFFQNGSAFIGSRWTSNNQGIHYNFAGCNVGIGTTALNERFTLSNGNAIMYSNLYVMNSIGIGKSNPAFALDVNGDLNLTGSATIRQNGNPAVFSQWSNTSNNVFITESNIGVGLSNPTTTFHVLGDSLFQGTMGTLALRVGRRNATIVAGTAGASGAGAYDNSSNLLFTVPNVANNFRFNVANSTIAVIDGNGRIGIGMSNPAYSLDVDGDINFTGTLRQTGSAFQTSRWSSNASGIHILSGNVGIGTSSPAYTLDVNGVVGATRFTMSGIKAINSWIDGSIEFLRTVTGGNTSSQWFITRGATDATKDHLVIHASSNAGCGIHMISNGGVSRMFINTSNGNVGIGTTIPSNRLHVEGSTFVNGTLQLSTEASIRQNTTTWTGDAGNGLGKLEYNSNRWFINAGADSTEIIRFRRGANDQCSIGNDGTMFYWNSGSGIRWDLNTDAAEIKFYSTGNGVGQSFLVIRTLDDSDEPIIFQQTNNERMRIHTNGFIGINNNAPTYTLHVGGDVYANGGWLRVSGDNGLFFENHNRGVKGGVSGDYGTIETHGSGKGSWEGYSIHGRYVFMAFSTTTCGIYNDIDNQWILYYERSDVNNKYIQLHHNGNAKLQTLPVGVSIIGSLGIGTFSPTHALHVEGNVRGNEFYSYGWFRNYGDRGLFNEDYGCHFVRNDVEYGNWRIYGNAVNNWNGLRFTAADITVMAGEASNKRCGFHYNGVGWALFLDENRNLFIPGDVAAYWSDKRLKTNLNQLDNFDHVLSSLTGYTFNWNKKGQELLQKSSDEIEVGLIAQDVQAVIPQAVKVNKAGKLVDDSEPFDYLTINYDKIIPYLVEGYKAQKKHIQQLTSRIEMLERMIEIQL